MAYDKAVDSEALDGALTGIANAIRGKTGSAEKLTLEGMAAAIAGIQAGGSYGISAAVMGEVTLPSKRTSITIEHGMSEKPDAIILYAPNFEFPSDDVYLLGFFWCGYPQRINADETRESAAVAMTTSANYAGFAYHALPVSVTETHFEAGRPSTVYYWQPAITFRWCAIKFAEV